MENSKVGVLRPQDISPWFFVDEEHFLEKHCIDEKRRTMQFYVEGIHCAGCLKKLENVKDNLPGVSQLDYNMSNHVLTAQIKPSETFSSLILALEDKGFKVKPIENHFAHEQLQLKEDRKLLTQVGVAAMCAGNIMLLAVSLYAGAEVSEFSKTFKWVAFALSLPVVLYAAQPLYQSAWTGLRAKRISVDLPIVLAILAGMIISFDSLLKNSKYVYFDSITALVFLVLSSRYLLRRIQRRYLSITPLHTFLNIQKATVLRDKDIQTISIDEVTLNDKIIVRNSELIPVDGRIEKGHSYIQSSLLTGESLPQEVREGDHVFMGTQNMGNDLIIQVKSLPQDARLQKIFKEVEISSKTKSNIIEMLDRVGNYFLIGVLLTATLIFAYFYQEPYVAFTRALSFVLVTCPCTFAFAAPLAFSLAMSKAAKNGILIKNPNVFEKLLGVKNIFFDKTGTLTEGQYEVLEWLPEKNLTGQEIILGKIKSLAREGHHPISKAIARFIDVEPLYTFQDIVEKPLVGISGRCQGDLYEIVTSDIKDFSGTLIKINNEVYCKVILGDKVRSEAVNTVKNLKDRNLGLWLISGDRNENAASVAEAVGIPKNQAFGKISPEEKQNLIAKAESPMMIGDGANDALALANARVGIAVQGSLEVSLKASDVYMLKNGLEPVIELFDLSERTIETVKRNLWISVFYNIIAGGLAITGLINPLLAAILMPVSSFTQTFSSLFILRNRGN